MKHATDIQDKIVQERKQRRAAKIVETAAAAVPAKREDVDDVIVRLLQTPTKENVDLIERLLDIRAQQAFNSALRAAQEEIPRILRDAHNDQTKSKYVRLDTVVKVINPIINRHGFSLTFDTADSKLPNHYKVTYKLSHTAGHVREGGLDVPAEMVGIKGNPNKTAMHALGSAVSYGRRYLMLMLFNVSLAGEDDDGVAGGHAPLTIEQLSALKDKIAEIGPKDPAKYAERLAKHIAQVDELASIPAYKFNAALAALLNAQVSNLTKAAEDQK